MSAAPIGNYYWAPESQVVGPFTFDEALKRAEKYASDSRRMDEEGEKALVLWLEHVDDGLCGCGRTPRNCGCIV